MNFENPSRANSAYRDAICLPPKTETVKRHATRSIGAAFDRITVIFNETGATVGCKLGNLESFSFLSENKEIVKRKFVENKERIDRNI